MGKPSSINCTEADPEGCGNDGFFKFSNENDSVEYLWPGSDMVEIGTYKQDNYSISVSSGSSVVFTFTLSSDGIELTDDEYDVTFRNKDYPWNI